MQGQNLPKSAETAWHQYKRLGLETQTLLQSQHNQWIINNTTGTAKKKPF